MEFKIKEVPINIINFVKGGHCVKLGCLHFDNVRKLYWEL